jgi:hypothetical protein
MVEITFIGDDAIDPKKGTQIKKNANIALFSVPFDCVLI